MTSSLAGKTFVVTGATGQVGWGIVHAALEADATVVLLLRSEAARQELDHDFGKARTSIVSVDFADESRLVSMRDAVIQDFGTIDHIIAPDRILVAEGGVDQCRIPLERTVTTLCPHLLGIAL